MAACKICNQEKKLGNVCTPHSYTCDGKTHTAILYGDEREGYIRTGSKPSANCHQCRVAIGKHHHQGCDIEVCPVCSKQLTICGCTVKIK